VCEQCEAFGASVVLIEDKASGTQLIQELIDYGLHAVTRYQPQSDKVMRSQRCLWQRLSRQAKLCFAESMHAQTAMIENGFMHLPKEAAWLPEYLHELTAFPKRKHDDQVDRADARLAQTCRRRPTSNVGIWHLYRGQYEAQQVGFADRRSEPLSVMTRRLGILRGL
jgi:hypothetical protein